MVRSALVFFIALVCISFVNKESFTFWGYYAHKKINRLAIFTLPPELGTIFKENMDKVELFAVAPDNRRHSSPYEAERHYIDIDHWGTYPFDNVPRNHVDAVWKFADIALIDADLKDTLNLKSEIIRLGRPELRDSLITHYYNHVRFENTDNELMNTSDPRLKFIQVNSSWAAFDQLMFRDNLDDYGILPYHLISSQRQLSRTFSSLDVERIIRYANELGHYIGDGHVPLHTTENYNGQMTDQLGIHAFWESRIPELFAESGYSFWVGEADYIEDIESFYWNIVLDSHSLVADVLSLEKQLRESFPSDQQYCFDERLGRTQRIECQEYARAYQEMMSGMVERQMQKSIKAIGSAWYTAWVDAGRPKLDPKNIEFHVDSLLLTEVPDNNTHHKMRNENQ